MYDLSSGRIRSVREILTNYSAEPSPFKGTVIISCLYEVTGRR